MSTNYYFELGSMSLHIGKTTADSVSFHAPEGPDGPVNSWERWRNIITLVPGRVVSEYGVELEPQNFFQLVERYSMAARREQYSWIERHANYDLVHYWLDSQGFCFTDHEFS